MPFSSKFVLQTRGSRRRVAGFQPRTRDLVLEGPGAPRDALHPRLSHCGALSPVLRGAKVFPGRYRKSMLRSDLRLPSVNPSRMKAKWSCLSFLPLMEGGLAWLFACCVAIQIG